MSQAINWWLWLTVDILLTGLARWLHVDMAGPSTFANGRATGYGVALLLELIGLGSETDQEWPPSA